MDKDRDGVISAQDLKKALSLGAVPACPEAELQSMFQAADMDKSCAIDYVEFVSMMLDTSLLTQ